MDACFQVRLYARATSQSLLQSPAQSHLFSSTPTEYTCGLRGIILNGNLLPFLRECISSGGNNSLNSSSTLKTYVTCI